VSEPQKIKLAVNVSPDGRSFQETETPVAPERQILIAAIGPAWRPEEDYATAVADLIEARELPSGVSNVDFGTGAIGIAYEVMRGYDALVLIDIEAGESGVRALSVSEVDEQAVDARIEDGQELEPNGMDVETVLRYIKYIGGWPGRIFTVGAAAPNADETEPGGLPVGPGDAVELLMATVEDLQHA
jgi:hydrogenase maturation protease